MAWQQLFKKMRKLDKEGSSSSLTDGAEIRVHENVNPNKRNIIHPRHDDRKDMSPPPSPVPSKASTDSSESSLSSSPSSHSPVPDVETRATVATTTTETEVKTKKTRRVSFETVEIRHYPLILGDNPFTEVPLSLGWGYESNPKSYTVDDHEDRKVANENYVHAQYLQPLDVASRQARLRGVGYTNQRIRQEERIRRINVLQEWSYRINRDDVVVCTIPKGCAMFKHYIL